MKVQAVKRKIVFTCNDQPLGCIVQIKISLSPICDVNFSKKHLDASGQSPHDWRKFSDLWCSGHWKLQLSVK